MSLRDEPSGCLAGLNSTCQNMAVGRALLDNVTSESRGKTGVVCIAMIDKLSLAVVTLGLFLL